MERGARRYGHFSDRSRTLDSGLEHSQSAGLYQDLRSRIRSLQLSRNCHYPPKTPCPSPDSSSASSLPEENCTESLVNTAKVSKATIDGTIANLAQLRYPQGKMVIRNYDGPAGQIEETDTDTIRKYPSQPSIEADHSFKETARVYPGLNQKAFAGVLGHDKPMSSTAAGRSASQKSGHGKSVKEHTGTRKPLYILQPVTPTLPRPLEERLRPIVQHVPGSYISEMDARGDDASVVAMQMHDNSSTPHNGSSSNTHPYDSPTAESARRAMDALGNFSERNNEHDSSPLVSALPTSIGGKRPSSTTKSNLSTTSTGHFLLKPTVEDTGARQPIGPVLTINSDDEGLVSKDGPGSNREYDGRSEPSTIAMSKEKEIPRLTPNHSSVNQYGNGHLNDTQLHDIHADTPQFAKETSDDLQTSKATEKLDMGAQISLLADHSPSLDTIRSSARKDVSDVFKTFPGGSGLHMPANQSTIKQDSSDFGNEATHLQRSSEVPSSMDFEMLNGITDTPRQVQPLRVSHKYPHQLSTTMPTPEPSYTQPKSDWVRHFLEKRPYASVTQGTSNLTNRLSQGQGTNINESLLNNAAKTIHAQQKPDSMATNSFQDDQMGSEATDLVSIAREQKMKTDAISKTILDLESLLREALIIANQAADKDKDTRSLGYHDTVGYNREKDGRPVSSGVNNDGEEYSQKEDDFRNHVIIVEPEYLPNHQGTFERARDATPYPANSPVQTRHTSLVPTAIPVQFSSDLAKAVATRSNSSESEAGLDEHGMVTSWSPLESSLRGPQSLPDSARSINTSRDLAKASEIKDWALASRRLSRYPEEYELLPVPRQPPQRPATSQLPTKESRIHLLREHQLSSNALSGEVVRDFIDTYHAPPVQPRTSSMRLRSHAMRQQESYDLDSGHPYYSDEDSEGDFYVPDFRNDGARNRAVNREWADGEPRNQPRIGPGSLPHHDTITSLRGPPAMDRNFAQQPEGSVRPEYSLKHRHHFSIRGSQGFSLSRSHPRAPIARDWSTDMKRHAATVACISTALLGLIIGIYAGEVPAIQYSLADEHHFTILGNVVFFVGLAIPTLVFWPLPLLHGRKPYTLAALVILLPLQFPQAVIVGAPRSPYDLTYRAGLLISRAFAGFVMGFANINFQTTLLDLFGSSLQSDNPHQEIVNENDVRRHGGGMGVWLGIWTWCFIGSLGIGFLIGAVIISGLGVQWGFWITIILTAVVLFLNVLTPEVRRSPYRRSMAEVRTSTDISRRIARGEIKMHLYATGPKHWWEEILAGNVLVGRMLKQPGFVVLSLYMAWIYGQVVLLIILLGALTSQYYRFRPQYVGLCVMAIPIGALLAIPFQKASLFSRSRHHAPRTDSMTFEKRVTWTSHLVRRAIFMIVLPFAGLAYTLTSGGRHIPFILPTLFAGLIGFLSNLAIAECNGIIMETYDTSDLQPGMTGRPRRILPEEVRKRRTNFSCFPRVTAAFAITQSFAFLIAAAASLTGGAVVRRIGAQRATAIVAGVLLALTLLLIAILTRVRTVQIVPAERYGTNVLSGPEDEWKPVIIGRPSGTTRRMSLLELGAMTRWTEIRKRNRLIPE